VRRSLALQGLAGRIELHKVEHLGLYPNPALLHNAIVPFARSHPEAEITVPLLSLSFTGPGDSLQRFLCLGWVLEKVFKAKKIVNFDGVTKFVKAWKGPGQKMNLPNLKFRTAVDVFDEVAFRQLMNTPGESGEAFVRTKALKLYKDREKLVETVRGWFENGI
jgi:hypothetical protein